MNVFGSSRDSETKNFNPPKAVLHYKDPNIYREMLDLIAEIVMESVSEELKKSICSLFKSMDQSINIQLTIKNISKEKLLGLTTDGKSANTGKKSGLCVRLREYLKRDILCIWCVTHRCDLAFSDIELMVTEVKHWKINIKSVATFYKGSAIHTDELKTISEKEGVKFYRFPQHFEVRFVEHLILLCESVWKNMPSMSKHWNNIVTADAETTLMMDVLRLFKRFQKDGQKSMVTLCDIETSKNIAISFLELMETDYYPGGKEEELKKLLDDQISDNSDEINYDDKIT
ncbi:hypothetical protein AGLY_018271 [Aphis glycines]|uniref:DUF4371 domain-containing protein n=1 Tax=Aphis glycines TaxID=307491 RepID=A0A6G0ST51_APHGL|nr:hypothetical protein AGLY_018271 [Aphis glycines]